MSRFRSVYDPGDIVIAGDVTALEGKFPVVTADIANGAVIDTKLATDSVTTVKIAADAVTQPKAATGVVDGDTITGSVFQTSAPGVGHSSILIDGPNNLAKFFSGVTSESFGAIDLALSAGAPALKIYPPKDNTNARRPSVRLKSVTGSSSDSGGEFEVLADTVALTSNNGNNISLTPSSPGIVSMIGGAATATTFAVGTDLTIGRYGSGAGMDTWQVVCSANATPTDTTNITIAGLSQAVTSPGTSAVYMVEIDADVTIGITNTANLLELLVDGVAQTATMVTVGAANQRVAAHKKWRITGLSAASHTFTARTRNTAGSTSATVNITHTLMTVERKS